MLKSVKEVYEEGGLTEGITEKQKKPFGGEYSFSLPCGFFKCYENLLRIDKVSQLADFFGVSVDCL